MSYHEEQLEPVPDPKPPRKKSGILWGRLTLALLGAVGGAKAAYHIAGAYEHAGDNGDREDAVSYARCIKYVQDHTPEGESRLVVSFPGVSDDVLMNCGISVPIVPHIESSSATTYTHEDERSGGYTIPLDALVSSSSTKETNTSAEITLPSSARLEDEIDANIADANDFDRSKPGLAAAGGALVGIINTAIVVGAIEDRRRAA